MNEKILVVDDERLIRWTLSEALRGWGYQTLEAANVRGAREIIETEHPSVTLLDINLPDGSGLDFLREIKTAHPDSVVIMITANVLVDDTIAALRAGAYDFIGKPLNLDEIRLAIRNSIETRELRTTLMRFQNERSKDFGFDQIIGDSPAMTEMKSLAEKVAASGVSSVLLQGESGTGKDLVAKAIHFASGRAARPFVAINCAAIPGTLMESELFGYEKGAFTDAKSRKEGLFEQAEGGTLFLDEIGEIDLSLQAKLLRVLEEGNFRRVGGLKDLNLNVRVIAASNRDLREESETGHFRLDLYYRLSIIQLDIPPLRSRGQDVLRLAAHFIETLGTRPGGPKKLSREAEKAFVNYTWRGNVRELRNAIERAMILEDGDEITLRYLPKDLLESNRSQSGLNAGVERAVGRYISFPPEGLPLDEVEHLLIEKALAQTGGNVTRAGELLGISRDRVRYHLKKMRRPPVNV
ncbi:MAG: sigma-54-dependent Fis family transcriptional regulator [Acidobacteria bacterium]|nr:sigma-54-dependent Fis family transcriptional regulator [Acidobacteriota bacterium]